MWTLKKYNEAINSPRNGTADLDETQKEAQRGHHWKGKMNNFYGG
jgi:hypothetical protein